MIFLQTLAYKSGFVEFARSIREQIDQMVLSGQLNTGQGTQNEALKCIQIVSTGKNVSSSENDEGNNSLPPLPFSFCFLSGT